MRRQFAWTVDIVAVGLAALIAVVASEQANAGKSPSRHESERPPHVVKDCTRFNGRWGYYGNPWCTPAEQRAFDRWEAQRHNRRRLR